MTMSFPARSGPGRRTGRLTPKRIGKAAVGAVVVLLHALLFVDLAKSLRPPSTLGDGSTDRVAMSVALMPASMIEDPKSQGEDAKTRALATEATPTPAVDRPTEVQGAGEHAAMESGGAHALSPGQIAQTAQAGGGGGTKDDPWARVSLKPEPLGTFDLAARNDALFLSRVTPCLDDDQSQLAGVTLSVALAPDGAVILATPIRPGVPTGLSPKPTRAEARVIKALKACAPYHDLVLGTTPLLKLPPAGGAMAPSLVASAGHEPKDMARGALAVRTP